MFDFNANFLSQYITSNVLSTLKSVLKLCK